MNSKKLIFLFSFTSLFFFIELNSTVAQMKPNLGEITSDKTAKKVEEGTFDSKTNETKTKSNNSTKANQSEFTFKPIQPGLKQHSLGLGVGQTFLRSDFNDYGEDKITFDFFYNYSASYSFDFLANLHYTSHKYQNTKTELKGMALGIKGKLYQFDAFAPFILGGFGFYGPQVTPYVNGVHRESDSKLVFGVHVGTGVDLQLNDSVSVGALFHFHDPFDVKQESGGKVEGYYYKLLMTVFYTFQ